MVDEMVLVMKPHSWRCGLWCSAARPFLPLTPTSARFDEGGVKVSCEGPGVRAKPQTSPTRQDETGDWIEVQSEVACEGARMYWCDTSESKDGKDAAC